MRLVAWSRAALAFVLLFAALQRPGRAAGKTNPEALALADEVLRLAIAAQHLRWAPDAAGAPAEARGALARVAQVRDRLHSLGEEGTAALGRLGAIEGRLRSVALGASHAVRPLARPMMLMPTPPPTGSITGKVVDALTGAPLSNVFIDIWDCRGNWVGGGSSDGSGVYTVPALAPGVYFASTSNNAGYLEELFHGASCVGFCDPVLGTAIPVTTGAASADFALRPGGRIAGIVTGPRAPASEVWVDIFDDRDNLVAFGLSGTDGTYTSASGLPTGTYYAVTSNRGRLLDEGYMDLPCGCGRCDAKLGNPIGVTLPRTTSGIDFHLAAGGVITGRVTDAHTGAPLTGSMTFSDGTGFCSGGSIDGLGNYTNDTGLPTGDYVVQTGVTDNFIDETYDGVGCPGVPPLTATDVSVVAGTTRTGIDFRLEPGGVMSGHIVDGPTGSPLADASVAVYFAPAGALARSAHTDATGSFAVPKLCASSYQVVATGPSRAGYLRQLYDGATCLRCDVGSGARVTVAPPAVASGIDFHLQQGARISGTLFDAATGATRKGVGVSVYDSTGAWVGSAKCDCLQGAYVAPDQTGLTSGDYVVTSGSERDAPYPYGYRTQLYRQRDCDFCDVRTGDPVTADAPLTTSGVDFRLVRRMRNGDYDRDGRSNIAIYQPDTGQWLVRSPSGATTTWHLGATGWLPAEGDFDNDGKTDPAVYSPTTAVWQVLQSSTGRVVTATALGGLGSVPVRGDFDGDRHADYAVYQPATGVWSIRRVPGGTTATFTLGSGSAVPVPADYDGDGITDAALYNPSTGVWTIRHSTNLRVETVTFGGSGQVATPLDFDGDGKADLATYRPSTGLWNIRQSATGSLKNFILGDASGIPVPLDYDGDGRTDAAIYEQGTHHWLIRLSATEAVSDTAYYPGSPVE